MSGKASERLKKLLSELKKTNSRVETTTTDVETNLFRELSFVYNSDDGQAIQEAEGVVIERYNDLSQHEKYIQFRRVTAVYEKDMYNKFFVPIWAAAMNVDRSVGYVLSPKLTPLREMLNDLKESYQTSEVYYDKLHEVLRLCFAPIALAIDALHTPIFNKRTRYHHRDICIDNVYMRVRKSIDSSGQETIEYDDARLKLAELTREALPDAGLSPPSKTPFDDYYHHDDVKYEAKSYDREHDWYSFGVYILEALHWALPITIQTDFRQLHDYTMISHVDSWILSTSAVDVMRPFLLQYLDIAVKCLQLKPNGNQQLSYEMPDVMKERFLAHSQTFLMKFEYSVSMWTAQLLWMYEESTLKERAGGKEEDLCQSCLLRPKEKISTKQHGRGNQPKCDEECQHHCLVCYTNEERLFCSKQHGTTGTVVDHRYSYALILYGESFQDMFEKDTESSGINSFEKEAKMLAKALNSKLICGLPTTNIHVKPVYGSGTPEDCLKGHCEEMRELIHGDGSSCCRNDTSYTLFTFYLGHSYHGCDKTVGDWCPSFIHTSDDTFEPLRLNRALVQYHMTSIQKCVNYGTSHSECQAACVSLNYLVNPCGPSPGSMAHQWPADKYVSIRKRSQPLVEKSAAICGITAWFCQMLQGLYHNKCASKPHLEDIQKRAKYHSGCKVPLGKVDVCFKLARYIYEELGDAFIDGECLRIHQKHLKTRNGYTELMVQIDDEHGKPVLAYYKPQGVFRNVFSSFEGEEQIKIDMDSDMTCEKIKMAVFNQIKDREPYRNKPLRIDLRSDDQQKHPLVSDDNVRDIIESSALFYHVTSIDEQFAEEMAAPEEDKWVECGFCCRRNEALEEPKTLPCGHVHCFGCLSDSLKSIHILKCPLPVCREVFDVILASLPSSDMKGGDVLCCDVCVKKGKGNKKADMYCTQCDKKYCTKHLENHDEVLADHKTISIETYKTQEARQQMRMCEEHKDHPCNVGCKKCLKVVCVRCLSELESCTDGGNHELMSVDELVKVLKKEINDLKEEMMDKEETLCELFKQTSKKISEYDDATKEMVQQIHNTRDEQMKALKVKYRKLEEELMQARLKVRADMIGFLEVNIGATWSGLINHRQKIDGRHKHSHQCDIVSGYKETKDEIQRLIDYLLPTLNIPKCTSLSTRDKCRDIELDILSVEGVQLGQTTPTSLTLLNTVKLSDFVHSVFSYKKSTYVGAGGSYGGSIAKIDERFKHSCWVRFERGLSGLAVYKDRVYSILYGSPRVLHVHDLLGKLLLKWNHPDVGYNYSGLVVCSDQLVVPDKMNRQLVVYALNGSVVKRISCAQISASHVSLCAVGDNSVVVSDYQTSKVFNVNISSGEIKWTCAEIAKPQGVTRYGEKYVLVACYKSNTVNILDVHTGKVISQITNKHICGSGDFLFDMHISGNTLVMANHGTHSVVSFQLNM